MSDTSYVVVRVMERSGCGRCAPSRDRRSAPSRCRRDIDAETRTTSMRPSPGWAPGAMSNGPTNPALDTMAHSPISRPIRRGGRPISMCEAARHTRLPSARISRRSTSTTRSLASPEGAPSARWTSPPRKTTSRPIALASSPSLVTICPYGPSAVRAHSWPRLITAQHPKTAQMTSQQPPHEPLRALRLQPPRQHPDQVQFARSARTDR